MKLGPTTMYFIDFIVLSIYPTVPMAKAHVKLVFHKLTQKVLPYIFYCCFFNDIPCMCKFIISKLLLDPVGHPDSQGQIIYFPLQMSSYFRRIN